MACAVAPVRRSPDRKAILTLSVLVGAISLARAVDDPELSEMILTNAAEALKGLKPKECGARIAWSNRCDPFSGNNRGRPSGGRSIGFEGCLNVEMPCAQSQGHCRWSSRTPMVVRLQVRSECGGN
jgi:hypothetical protein